jgi:fatty-acyl-CoA synthase
VYGVAIPGADGRAGMAEIVCRVPIDLAAFRDHLARRLPRYAHPVLLRLRDEIDITATFKPLKHGTEPDGYDPRACSDRLYVNDPEQRAYVVLDKGLYERICTGVMQL